MLKNDDDLRSRLGMNGRRFVLENFEQRITGQIVLDEYERCFNPR